MTDPGNPWQADSTPPVQPVALPPGYGQQAPGWGGYGAPQGYGQPGWPAQPKRPWYRAPGSLIGAATFSAVSAWITLAGVGFGAWYLTTMDSIGGGEAFAMWLMLIFVFPIIGLVVVGGFCLTVAGAAATVPLAVIWFRTPNRSAAAGLHLIHAVVSWAVLATVLVWLPL